MLSDYTQYANECAAGLKEAFQFSQNIPLLGGPAGLFRKENHPFCWNLLESCNRGACPIQFISFHRKGNGTAEGVLNGTLELLDLLHNKFPNLRELPIANEWALRVLGLVLCAQIKNNLVYEGFMAGRKICYLVLFRPVNWHN